MNTTPGSNRPLLAGALAAAAFVSCHPDGSPGKVADGEALERKWTLAADRVDADRLRAHMLALSSDAMEGRQTGTAGYLRAVGYVARELQALGLEPIGDGGGFLQAFELLEARLSKPEPTLRLASQSRAIDLDFADDFIRSGGFGAASERLEAPLVFVGYGVHAPELGHDDFAGVAVRGAIVVALSGAPPWFGSDERAYYSSGSTKRAIASERGAVGILTVRTPVDQERRPWSRLLEGLDSPAMTWLDRSGRPAEEFPDLVGSAVLGESGAALLFELAGRDLPELFQRHADGRVDSFDLGVTAAVGHDSAHGRVASANVVGVLRGSDPRLREEFLLVTAHLDHLGVRRDESGALTDVYHGAYDNAAGVATLLEVARVLAETPVDRRRSVIFAALGAEEQGMQGSGFLAHHPPVPLESLVANLNIDMPYLGFPIADVEAFGAEHSTLLAVVQRAAAASGITWSPDSMPERVRFVRSDQFSFVRRGIPGLNLKPGGRSADPEIDGAARLAGFLSDHYHQPTDDASLPFSRRSAETFARVALLSALIVADEEARPEWNPGDFFGERFADAGAGARQADSSRNDR